MNDADANSKKNESNGAKLEFDRLHGALVLSSNRNTRLLVFFVVALLYVFFSVVSVSDLDLLLPHSVIVMPLLRFEMPLYWFFVVAPAFIVMLHFNLLLNLRQHAEKLRAWENHAESNDVLLPGYFFNFVRLLASGLSKHRLVAFLLPVVMCVFPLVVVVAILIRFADYHSLIVTAWQTVAVLVECLILKTYWYPIVYPELSGNGRYDLDGAVGLGEAPNLFAAIVRRLIWPHYVLQPYRIVSRWYPALLLVAFFVSVIYVMGISLIKLDFFEVGGASNAFLPKLDISEQTIYKTAPSDAQIHSYIISGKGEDSAWIDHAVGIDLRGRDLRIANLERANLFKALMQNSRLDGAQMSGVNLSFARLDSASLNRANLSSANMKSSRLNRAMLNEANLEDADFTGAFLVRAQLNSSHLERANMSAADLGAAELNGAELWKTDFKGAYLGGAKLNGAFLEYADLSGAVLWNAELNGAYLMGARLNGTDCLNAKLNGANLLNAQLNGANLSNTELVGAYFEGAELNGAWLDSAKFRGSHKIDVTKWKGICFPTGIDTLSVPDWDYLHEKSELIPDTSRRRIFVDNITRAQKNADFVHPALRDLWSDTAGFVRIQEMLSCSNSYVAEGLLGTAMRRTYTSKGDGSLTPRVPQALLTYMSTNCLDNLLVVQNRTSWRNDLTSFDLRPMIRAISEIIQRRDSTDTLSKAKN